MALHEVLHVHVYKDKILSTSQTDSLIAYNVCIQQVRLTA